jgi:outer membrane protein TolC
MRKPFAAALALAFVVNPSLAGAQSTPAAAPISLRDAVRRVESDGFDVRMALAQATLAAADVGTARAAYLPQIGVSGTATDGNLPQLGMPIARQAYVSANVSVPIFNPSLWAAARAAALDATAADQSADLIRSDAAFGVALGYHRAQLAAGLVDIRNVGVRDQEEHVRLTEQRVAAGKLPRYLIARDRAALAASQQMLEDEGAEKDRALIDLAALLNYDVDAPLTLADPLTRETFEGSRDTWMRQAAVRPDVAAARSRLDAARARLDAAGAAYAPTLALNGQTYNGTSNPALGAGGGQITATVTLPLADGGTRSAAVHRARADVDRTLIDYQRTLVAARRDLADAWREREAAIRNLDTADAARADAEEQLRVARLRERAGKAIDIEVLDALTVAANARETALRALTRYNDSAAAVRRAAALKTP